MNKVMGRAHLDKRSSPTPSQNNARELQTERAYNELKRQIFDNEMPPGFQITEQELAIRLQVSRTPTREAMLRLASEGLVEIRPRHGMLVKRVSIDDVREIYEILTALESYAALLASARDPRPPELREMKQCIEKMGIAVRRNDLKEWARNDERFHHLLAQASGNNRLAEAVDTYVGQAHRLRMMTLLLRPMPTKSNHDHELLIKAIDRRDGSTAQRIHREHRERGKNMQIAILTKHNLSNL